MISPLDTVTLQAFALALSQFDQEVPDELRQEIQSSGNLIARQEFKAAAEQIRALVQQSDRLQDLFQAAYDQLQEQVETRAKFAANPAINTASVWTNPATLPIWTDIVAMIATASDFTAMAKKLLQRVKSQPAQFPQEIETDLFLNALAKSVAATDAIAIQILRAIEQQLLYVEDIADRIGLPVKQTIHIVQRLWAEDYIYPAGHHPLTKLLSPFKKTSPLPSQTTEESVFNLTSKGYFYLHPIVQPWQREVMHP